MNVGFVGLGSMGSAMASSLLRAGIGVSVWNRSPGPVEALRDAGADVAASAADAARGGILHSMLADDRAVRAVIDDGVLDALADGGVHVNHATVSVQLARELAAAHRERGIAYVAAPVFGRPDAAAAAKLHILAAGPAQAIERVRPQLEAMGQRIWPLGESPESASAAKIAGNFMIAAAIESMAEASALVRAHGVSAADFLDIIGNSLFASPVYKGYGAMIAEQRYAPPGFTMKLGFKDVGLALDAGIERQVPLPIAGLLRDAMLQAMAAGDGDLDWAALARVAAARAHLD